ncbi:MAG: tRNA-Thr(GGU) m(6)t(6)A37 methyltransferase TsaA [Cellvibrionaceae bacterium]
MTYILEPLGYIQSCFPEKFGIPRQPLLAPSAKAELLLLPPFNDSDCIEGLNESSHVWLSFIFHQHINARWKAKVRPPRLGGNKKSGVFATRSSFRPNHLGLSAVKLEKIETGNNQVRLFFSGIDLLDGTPIVDIKPYIPYSDSIPSAFNSLAELSPTTCPVMFNQQAKRFCATYSDTKYLKTISLEALLTEVLQQDPRPAYKAIDENRHYKMKMLDLDVEWRCCLVDGNKTIEVINIKVIS